ncbi:MAG: M23 family metallopeptidase [Bacteroidota bacterium]
MLRKLYRRIQARLIKKYRVELIDDITLSQSRQFLVKPITVFVIGSLLLIGIVVGTAALVIYTPNFHVLIPGYINPEEAKQKEAIMAAKIARMDEETRRFEAYISSLKRVAGVGNDSVPVFSQERLDSLRKIEEQVSPPQEEEPNPAEQIAASTPAPTQQKETLTTTTQKIVYLPEERIKAMKLVDKPLLLNLFPPLIGEIRKAFDISGQHYGVDIVAEENSLIKSIAEGFVILSEYSDENGWVIGVASKEGVVAFYKHNSSLLKKSGDYVRAGEPIAKIGNTGENSTGPHLHFELWQNGELLNPVNYIRFNQ